MVADFRKIFNILQTVPFVEYTKNNTKHREKIFLNSRAGLPMSKRTHVEFSAELDHKHTHIMLCLQVIKYKDGHSAKHVRRRRSTY